MTDEPHYRPRRHDHLVEPMIDALHGPPEEADEEPAEPPPRRGCAALLVLFFLLPACAWAALTPLQ